MDHRLSLGALALCGSLGSAMAQEERGANPLVEEIVVTAQKREEAILTVPLSVQAFSADALEAHGIDDPAGLQQITPGMQYGTQLGYSQIYIRGLGTDSFIPSSDSTVATYIDGVYFPMAFGAAAELGAIERVEVLKGPQGTLFGRNSTGGAINIVMRQPDETPSATVETSYERFNRAKASAYVNLPLADALAVSAAGRWADADSYYEPSDESPLRDVPGDASNGYALKARWDPTESFEAVLGFNYAYERSGAAGVGSYQDPKPLGQALLITEAPDYETHENRPGYGGFRMHVASLKATYAASWFDTRLILADIKNETYTNVDFDSSPRPIAAIISVHPWYDMRTAELQFVSNDESWGSDWLKWIGGVYALDSSVGYEPLRIAAGSDLVGFLARPGGLGLLPQLTEPVIDAVTGLPLSDALLPYVDSGMLVDVYGSLDTESVAGFAQATVDFTDWMALTVGGRYQRETRKLGRSHTELSVLTDDAQAGQGTTVSSFDPQRVESSNFSPKVALDFKPAPDMLVYALWAKGYKSGTFNIVNISAAATYVKPEKVDSYELGYKASLLDGSLRVTAAVFENKAKNVQGQIVSVLSGGLASLLNNGSARIRGADVDGVWQPAPQALPGFVVTGGACYLDGEYTHYPEGSGYDPVTGLFFGPGALLPGRDFSGNRTVRTPKWSGNLGLSQTLPLGAGSAELAVDAYTNSGIYYSAQNSALTKEGAYTTLGAHASWTYDPWNLKLTVFGHNLTDEKYVMTLAESDFGTGVVLAPPAIYGVRARWTF
ncbi:MAG TPA: TonB-dependent receptor [Nevskiaceae bacterium]|nr:TonB-dependent receptor [Nevskiaceae bacterium]